MCSVRLRDAMVVALLISVFPGLGTLVLTQSSGWLPPVSISVPINSQFNDSGPAISADGLTLYFTSDRQGGAGGPDLWVAHRASQTASWSSPVNLGIRINTPFVDRNPALSQDGRRMFFASERPGGLGESDIWVTWRADENDDLGWHASANLGSAINTAAREAGPTYLEHEGQATLYFVSIRGGNDADIYVSEINGAGHFDRPRLVTELNSSWGDARPAIRRDGLELFFQSFREGSLGGCREQACFDLWVSHRTTIREGWSMPVNLGPAVNTRFAEADAALSSDFRTLFFASDRPGGYGGTDLYLSRRTMPGGL